MARQLREGGGEKDMTDEDDDARVKAEQCGQVTGRQGKEGKER